MNPGKKKKKRVSVFIFFFFFFNLYIIMIQLFYVKSKNSTLYLNFCVFWFCCLMVYQPLCIFFFNTKVILVEEQQWYYLIHSFFLEGGTHIFCEGISPKVNAIVQVKFKLAYYGVTFQQVSHFATGDSPHCEHNKIKILYQRNFESNW